MKIVCDNCATKYSIADEKVSGKVFKIRCKKCSHIIVVRGGEGADKPVEAPSAARSEATGSDEAVWHLVIDREQVGPITADEVRQKFAAGEVDVETYAWREGFADWLRLGSIDDFAELAKLAPVAAAAAPAAVAAVAVATAAAPAASSTKDLFGGGDEAEGDLFAGAGNTTVDMPDASGSSGGLFGGGNGSLKSEPLAAAAPEPAAAPRAKRQSSPAVATQAAAPSAEDASKMTGQRNENSMLFSLSSLQSMATGASSSSSKSSSSSPSSSSSSRESGPPPGGVDTRPGFANSQSEGSGLIDIRAMAASTLKKKDDKQDSSNDDLPSFSAPPVFSPVAAPILMPVPQSGTPPWLWPVVGLGVAAVLSIVVVGVLLLNKKPDVVAANPPVVAAAPAGTTGGAPTTAAPATAPAGTHPAPAAPEGTKPEGSAPVAAAKPEGKGKDKGKKGESKPGTPEAKPVAAAPETKPAATSPSPGKKKGRDEIDDLLNSASPESKAKPEKKEPKDDDSLPDQLDKGQIVGGMGKVKSTVYNCYLQYKVPGVAMVAVTIGKSGKVQSASVGGELSGTPTGACVERAVKSASFPQFKGSPQSVNYPFQLR